MHERPTLKNTGKALLYLAPALAIILVFNIYPILKSLEMSFYTDYDYFKDIVYARGIDNFRFIFRDPNFHLALKNTLLFVGGVVPISMILSLMIASLFHTKIKFKGFFQTIYFLPFVTSIVAVTTVWRWIFHKDYGLLNFFLNWLGVSPIAWLSDPKWAMASLILLSIWKGLGYNIILFLTGLQNIDKQYYLAAQVDGASRFRRFIHVTLPLLSPTIFFISIVSVIGSFKVFDEVFALFGGKPGPVNSALTIVYYIFEKFYGEWKFGIASAAAYVLFIIILILTLIQLYIGNKKVHY